MNRSGIEKAIRNTVNSAPGLSFDKLAAMPYIKLAEQDYITKQKLNFKVSRTRQFSLAAACCLVIIVLLSGWYIRNRVPDSVITLDVNPSIEIRTNLKNEILSVRAINEDAKEIINNEYKGEKLEAVVPLLMNALVERKYINTDHNAILLTVTNRSSHKADSVIKKIDSKIRESLLALNITPTILSQKLSKEAERAKLAGQYGLSEGKLKLILDIIANNSSYTLEDLAGRSLMQLLEIAKANSVDLRKYFSQEEGNSDSGNNPGNITKEDTGEINDTEDNTDQEDSYLEENNSDQEDSYQEEDNSKDDNGESKNNEDLNTEEHNKGVLNNEEQNNQGQDIEGNDKEDKQYSEGTATIGQGDEGDKQDSQISEDTEEEDRKEDALSIDNKDAFDYNNDQEDSSEDSYNNNDGDSNNDSEDLNNWNDNSDNSSEDSNNWNDNSDNSSGDEDNQGNKNED